MENASGAVRGNSQNTATTYTPRTESKFNLMYHFFNTHRFAEYTPHYWEDSVKRDRLPIRSSHSVKSYTMKSPLMQTISMSKDYFSVPYEAILPLNWEKFFDHPVQGDDVLDDVGPTVENFWTKVATFVSGMASGLNTQLGTAGTTAVSALEYTFRFIVTGEYFYSNGSLMSSLGCHGAPYFQAPDAQAGYVSFDFVVDKLCNTIEGLLGNDYFIATIDGVQYRVGVSYSKHGTITQVSLRHFLCMIRDNPVFQITSLASGVSGVKAALLSDVNTYLWNGSSAVASFRQGNIPEQLSRLWAYQLVCSHYYSNDHIDFVYSAELYRQLIGHYIRNVYSSSFPTQMFFTRNGIQYQYDYLSAHAFDLMIPNSVNLATNYLTNSSNIAKYQIGYMSALFAFRRSLRYLDYFTGSRSQPLAVIGTGAFANTNVPVSNNSVSVIDITRSIQSQRFLNAVNRVRHSFEGYLKGIFGGEIPAPDYHNPFFLAHTDDIIYGDETSNTGSDMYSKAYSITSTLHSNGSRYMFEIRSDRPAVILGITHYDIPRVYTRSIERSFFHQNRYDMFNPFMQYIGDQPIYQQELGIAPSSNSLSNFSYTLRHMEYKQRYFQASGGFVENLPGWIFVASDQRGGQTTINPDWIRSVSSEFDDFYVRLTGYSLGSYFHFIVDNTNDCTGSRPMAYAPTIL